MVHEGRDGKCSFDVLGHMRHEEVGVGRPGPLDEVREAFRRWMVAEAKHNSTQNTCKLRLFQIQDYDCILPRAGVSAFGFEWA